MEPNDDDIPIDLEDFPPDIQTYLLVVNQLSDRFDGMSGTYLGKDFTNLEQVAKYYLITDMPSLYYFAKIAENAIVSGYEKKKKKAPKKRP